jgi:hypothetical protein
VCARAAALIRMPWFEYEMSPTDSCRTLGPQMGTLFWEVEPGGGSGSLGRAVKVITGPQTVARSLLSSAIR